MHKCPFDELYSDVKHVDLFCQWYSTENTNLCLHTVYDVDVLQAPKKLV